VSSASNETTIRRFFEVVWNKGDVAQIDAFLAPDFRSHNGLQVAITDSAGYAHGVLMMRTALPDLSTMLELVFSDGDYVCVRGRDRGTHVGELFGRRGGGRTVTMTWIEIFRMQDGRAAEGWVEMDTADFFRQLEGS